MEKIDDKAVGRDSDKFMLRLPDGMREKIATLAKESGRSMNAEIVKRLEDSFMLPPELDAPPAQMELILDSSGYPISWIEILEHIGAIRDAADLNFTAMNTYVITPELLSTSKRLQQIPKLMEFYEREKRALVKKPPKKKP